MNTINITLEFTKENLEKLKLFFGEADPKPAVTLTPDGAVSVSDTMPEKPDVTVVSVEKEEPKLSKTDLRAAALKLSKAGKRDALAKIFKDHGGKSLSDFNEKPELFGPMIAEIEEALNA